jgi:flavorubredoxin
MPPPLEVSTDVKTVQLEGGVRLFQCFCDSYLRFESEYGLKRGTTSNAYLLSDGDNGLLIDVPRKEYLQPFCASSVEPIN